MSTSSEYGLAFGIPRGCRRTAGCRRDKLKSRILQGGSFMRTKLLMAVAIGVSLAASAAQAQDKVKIGVLVTLEGVLTTLGEDSLRGLEVALKQAGNKAGGKTIETITFPTNASPDLAIRGAR